VDLTGRVEQKPSGVKEPRVTSLVGRAGGGGDGGTIDLSDHLHVPKSHPIEEVHRRFDAVDGSGNNSDTSVGEQEGVRVEVNQLLTAVRSPMTSVEQHRAPRTSGQLPDRDIVAITVLSGNGRNLGAVVEHVGLRRATAFVGATGCDDEHLNIESRCPIPKSEASTPPGDSSAEDKHVARCLAPRNMFLTRRRSTQLPAR